MEFSSLSPAHEALINLAQCIIGKEKWEYTARIIKHVITLTLYEGADMDVTLCAALFYQSRPNNAGAFTQNILESIAAYPAHKITEVRNIIDAKSQSLSSRILHDAIILTSLDDLTTNTGKAMIAEKSGLLRMLSQQMKAKVTSR